MSRSVVTGAAFLLLCSLVHLFLFAAVGVGTCSDNAAAPLAEAAAGSPD